MTVFAAGGKPSRELASARTSPSYRPVNATRSPRNVFGAALRGMWNRRAHSEMKKLLATLDPARTVVHLHCWTKALSSSVIAAVVDAEVSDRPHRSRIF